MTSPDLLIGLLSAVCTVFATAAGLLASDVRLWRDEAKEMRQMWLWERDQSKCLRAALEDERKRHREGVYR